MHHPLRLALLAAALGVALATPAHSQPLPAAAPESVGFSATRLQRIDAFFASENCSRSRCCTIWWWDRRCGAFLEPLKPQGVRGIVY